MQIAVLGPLEVHDDAGTPVVVGGARLRTLLSLLALEAGRVVTGSSLIEQIWGAHPPEAGPNALQALVSRLRRRLPDGAVESSPAGYRLAVPPEAVDVHRFTRLAATGRSELPHDPAAAAATLDQALALWRGQPLPDLAGTGATEAELARLTELRLAAVEDRADALLRAGSGWQSAGRDLVADLGAVAHAHPTRERTAGLLMRALVAAGRGGEALTAYERTRSALAERLGTDPSPDLADLHRRVLRRDPALTAPPADPAEPVRTNLPAELTSFVGREEEIARIGKMVGEHRLTTLTGAGGTGKTRLAVAAARTLLGQAPDGVWLVELAPLTTAAELPHAILTALGLRSDRGRPTPPAATPASAATAGGDAGGTDSSAEQSMERLAWALATQAPVLVLDNCEHLVTPVAGLVHRLLRACPGLRVLATSREPLAIPGEALWPVEPLALPPCHPARADPATLLEYPAVRLLADRAAAVQPSFTVDEDTAPAVVAIARALDGIPLAIELAAARLRTMTPGQLAARLDRHIQGGEPPDGSTDARFRLLTGGSRTALPRHQTLRAVVDWSWHLLERSEQALLRRLAYFAGPITAPAAEAVCAGGPVLAEQVPDLLTALVDKSLLAPAGPVGDQPGYRMLDTIQAYGLDRLAEAGETDRIRRAYAAHYLALAETAEPLLRSGEQPRWLARLAAEHDNLHGALRGALAARDAALAVRLVAALGWYWTLAGHRLEGLELARQALALPGGEVSAEARALACSVSACGGVDALSDAEARRWFEAAAAMATQTDQRHPLLRLVGPLTRMIDSWRWSAQQPPTDMDELAADPDPWVRAVARVLRVHMAYSRGRHYPEMGADAEEALADYRRTGDRWGIGLALHTTAEVACLAGDLATAVARNQQAVATLEEVDVPEDRVMIQVRLAEQHWARGEPAAAWAVLAAAEHRDRLCLLSPRSMVARAAGDLARQAGDLAAAGVQLQRAWELVAELPALGEHRVTVAAARGQLAVAAGDLPAARSWLASALTEALAADSAPAIARALVGMADLALAEGRAERAAELLGTAEAVRDAVDPSLPDGARIAAAAGAVLGDPVFAAHRTRGRFSSPTVDSLRQLAGTIGAAVTPAA